MQLLNKKILKNITIIFLILISLLIYKKFDSINFIVNIIFTSFVISYAIKPIRNFVSRKFKVSTRLASLIIILMFITTIVLIAYFMIPTIIEEGKRFNEVILNLEEYVVDIAKKMNFTNDILVEDVHIKTSEEIKKITKDISGNLMENSEVILRNLIGGAIVPVISYYFLADGELIYNRILLIFPANKRVIIKKINSNIDKVLSRYIISQLVLSGIIGVMTFLMLIILKIKFSLILSLINGVVNIIPYFGPIIGVVPILFVAAIDSPSKAIFAIVGSIIIQQIEGDLLAPKITGDSTKLHPIIIIILLVFGEQIGGVLGMVLAVPIVVILKVIYDDINYYLF